MQGARASVGFTDLEAVGSEGILNVDNFGSHCRSGIVEDRSNSMRC